MASGTDAGESLPAAHAELLARFGATAGEPLGGGGEATVYALDADRVLRLFHGEPWGGATLEDAYNRWSRPPSTSFALPEVLDSGVEDGQWWQVHRRFPGCPVSEWLRVLDGPDRARLLQRYVDAAFEVASIEAAPAYGELLGVDRYPSWADCLRARLAAPYPRYRERLAAEVPGFAALVRGFDARLPDLYDGEPRLVHVDYFPGNVMAERVAGDARDASDFRISAVFDFAAHSLFGDPLLDVVGAIVMASLSTDVSEAEQSALANHAGPRAGARLGRVFDSYRAFYALYYAMDPALLPWCADQLRRSSLA